VAALADVIDYAEARPELFKTSPCGQWRRDRGQALPRALAGAGKRLGRKPWDAGA
jgi:hypothetical protein